MTDNRIPVILDMDTGVDDALALTLAALSPEFNILALTAVYGNRPVSETAYNTLKVAEALGLNAPVAAGAAKALLEPPIDYSVQPVVDIHGKDGLGNAGHLLPEPIGSLSPHTACELMAKTIKESPVKVTLIATGPLTNIAVFLSAHPELHCNIDKILFMGGAAVGGNLKPTAEANAGHDPEATAVVLTSGLPVYMFGLDATMSLFITEEERIALGSFGEYGNFLSECLAPYSAIYRAIAGLPGAVLHDSLPIAWLLDSSVASLGHYYTEMDLCGGTRGCTVVDTADILRKTPNTYVAMSSDRERFISMHFDALKRK